MIPKVFDFIPEFIDFNYMLSEELAWHVTNGEVFNINHMSDEELRHAIVDDVLGVTMWCKQTEKTVSFTMKELCRYLTPDQVKRVEEAMQHEEVFGLFDPHMNEQIRILDNSTILQAAMDYIGVWFTGYVMPEATVLMIDREKINEVLFEHGGIDNLCESLAMDLSATVQPASILTKEKYV